jgi:hypothetical protein
MEINFQFGTFEGTGGSLVLDLLVAVCGAAVGIAGAYTIYLVSIWQVRRDRLKYVSSLLESVISSTNKQVDYCRKYSEELLQNPLDRPLLQLVANRDLKRLADKVDQEGVFHAFINFYKRTNKAFKTFKDLYGFIDYLDYLLDQILVSNERTVDAVWERKKNYAIAFRDVKEKVESFLIKDELSKEFPAYVQFLSKTLNDFFENNLDGENMIYSYNSVIIPIREYLMKNGPVIDLNTELMFLLNNALNIYTGIEMAAKHSSEEYKMYGSDLANTVENLKLVTSQLMKDHGLK